MRAQRLPWSRSDCRTVVRPAGAAASVSSQPVIATAPGTARPFLAAARSAPRASSSLIAAIASGGSSPRSSSSAKASPSPVALAGTRRPAGRRVTSGLAPGVKVAVPPVPGHRVGHGWTRRPGEQRPVAVAVDRKAEHDGPGRAGEGQPADRRGGGPVVDADHGQSAPVRPGVHDGREPAGRDRVQDRVVVAGGPHDEPVHHGVGDPLHVAGGPGGRDQGETDALGRADLRHAGQEPGRLRVVEGVGQPLAEDHPEAARPAPAQRPGPGMRAG